MCLCNETKVEMENRKYVMTTAKMLIKYKAIKLYASTQKKRII